MQIDAMGAVRAVNKPCFLFWMFRRILDVSHSSVLPWIFDGVEEVDSLALIIESAKLRVCLIDSWVVKILTKGTLAVCIPRG